MQVRQKIMARHMEVGGFDDLLKTRMAGRDACREFDGSILRQLPAIRESRTYVVTQETKSSTRRPL